MSDTTPWRTRISPRRADQRPPSPRRGSGSRRTSMRDLAPDLAVPWTVRVAGAWAWRFLVIAATAVVLGYLVLTFKTLVVAVIIAVMLAVLLDPVARWLRRVLRFPRAAASLTAMLLMIAVVTGLLVLAGRSIVEGFGALADRAVAGFDELLAWLSDGPLQIDQAQIEGWLDQLTEQLQANSSLLTSGVLNATGSITSVLTGAILVLFSLFFFLKDGRPIWRWVVRLFPAPAREPVNEAGIRGWVTVGQYTRTQILVAFVDAIGIAVGAAILGVPLALPIGVLVFLGAFIPIVGALLSGSVAVLVALVDQGVVTALLMLGVVLLVQQLEGNLLQPWLQGNALNLHPIAIVFAVTAGTGVAGVLGALLAVPIAAVANTVALYLTGHDKYPYLANDPDRPGGPPGEVTAAIEEELAHIGDDHADHGGNHHGSGERDEAGEPGEPAEEAESGTDRGRGSGTATKPEVGGASRPRRGDNRPGGGR